MDSAWVRVEREISQVARRTAEEVEHRSLGRSGEPPEEMGERDAEALAAGPLAGLLSTVEDTEAGWVRAGLAWQRVAPAAHAGGLAGCAASLLRRFGPGRRPWWLRTW